MEIFVNGRLSTILYKAACVGNEEQMRAFLNILLDHSGCTADRPEDLFQLAEQLYISASDPENTIDLRCIHMDGRGQFEVGLHDCGLYYAIITYRSVSKDSPAKFISLQKETGVFINIISTGTYKVGYEGIEYEIIDGEIEEDYEFHKEMAYALYCRLFAPNLIDGFVELLKDGRYSGADVEEMIGSYRAMKIPADCEAEDIPEMVTHQIKFDCHKGAEEDLILLGILCAGLDDRNYEGTNWAKLDEYIKGAESTKGQTAGMLLRLIHSEGLDEAVADSYRKTVRKRKKAATALALQNDRDHWLEKLIELDALYNLEEQLENTACYPRCARLLEKEHTQLTQRPSPQQLSGSEKRIEIFRNLDEGEVWQLGIGLYEEKLVTLRADGTVSSPYSELDAWKDISKIYCVGGILVGLTQNGTLRCHATEDHPHLDEMEKALSAWEDIVSLMTNMTSPYSSSNKGMPAYKPEECYCVGLKRDGSLVSCGKKLRGTQVVSDWPAAQQVFTDKNSYGIVTKDGRIHAFGRLSYMESLKNVQKVEPYGDAYAVHFSDGTATYYQSAQQYCVGIKKLIRFNSHEWVASSEFGFRTNHEFYGYKPCVDGLYVGGTELRLRKYGNPVDYVCLNNALAALYENGNVKLFAPGRKAGEIVAKKAVRIAVENGAIIAYCK